MPAQRVATGPDVRHPHRRAGRDPPDAVAVECEGTQLTYGQLNRQGQPAGAVPARTGRQARGSGRGVPGAVPRPAGGPAGDPQGRRRLRPARPGGAGGADRLCAARLPDAAGAHPRAAWRTRWSAAGVPAWSASTASGRTSAGSSSQAPSGAPRARPAGLRRLHLGLDRTAQGGDDRTGCHSSPHPGHDRRATGWAPTTGCCSSASTAPMPRWSRSCPRWPPAARWSCGDRRSGRLAAARGARPPRRSR